MSSNPRSPRAWWISASVGGGIDSHVIFVVGIGGPIDVEAGVDPDLGGAKDGCRRVGRHRNRDVELFGFLGLDRESFVEGELGDCRRLAAFFGSIARPECEVNLVDSLRLTAPLNIDVGVHRFARSQPVGRQHEIDGRRANSDAG